MGYKVTPFLMRKCPSLCTPSVCCGDLFRRTYPQRTEAPSQRPSATTAQAARSGSHATDPPQCLAPVLVQQSQLLDQRRLPMGKQLASERNSFHFCNCNTNVSLKYSPSATRKWAVNRLLWAAASGPLCHLTMLRGSYKLDTFEENRSTDMQHTQTVHTIICTWVFPYDKWRLRFSSSLCGS